MDMDKEKQPTSDTAALPDYLLAAEEEAAATYAATPRRQRQPRPQADPWQQRAEADHLPEYANEDLSAQYYPPKQASARQRRWTEWLFLALGLIFALGIIVATLLAIPDLFSPHY